jgi:hypothetical protein
LKLSFVEIENHPNLMTEGKVVVEINECRFARAGLKNYRDSWREIVEN